MRASDQELSTFDGTARDMWTHDRQGSGELLNLYGREAGGLNCVLGLAIGGAAVPHPSPDGPYCRLDSPQPASTWCCDMFDKQELSAGFEHAKDLAERFLLIHNAAKNEGADHEIHGAAFDRQGLRGSGAEVHVHIQALCLLRYIPVHVRVRLDADPANVLCGEVTKVRSGSRADLKNGSREIRKQFRFVWREVVVRLVSASGHEPGEHLQAKGAGAAAEGDRGNFRQVGRAVQCLHYIALGA